LIISSVVYSSPYFSMSSSHVSAILSLNVS
jgi:hypothetical protein